MTDTLHTQTAQDYLNAPWHKNGASIVNANGDVVVLVCDERVAPILVNAPKLLSEMSNYDNLVTLLEAAMRTAEDEHATDAWWYAEARTALTNANANVVEFGK